MNYASCQTLALAAGPLTAVTELAYHRRRVTAIAGFVESTFLDKLQLMSLGREPCSLKQDGQNVIFS
jgi:hypothetical protein